MSLAFNRPVQMTDDPSAAPGLARSQKYMELIFEIRHRLIPSLRMCLPHNSCWSGQEPQKGVMAAEPSILVALGALTEVTHP